MFRCLLRAELACVAGLLICAFVVYAPGPALAQGVELLYDGEPGGAPLLDSTCSDYAADHTTVAHSGAHSLELLADPWHFPSLRLFCGGAPRRNFGAYDVIEFYMRAADPANPPTNPTVRAATWHATSHEVDILAYIDGGVLDGTWRRVEIPLAALATPTWSLNDVEQLQWGTDAAFRRSLVDDIRVRDASAVELDQVIVDSAEYLRLRVSERFDPDAARDPALYTITSTGDPAYATPRAPIAIGVEWRVVDFAGDDPVGSVQAPILRYDITLRLPEALASGVSYDLTVTGVTDVAGNAMAATTVPVMFDRDALNTNIKINHAGYLPESPKFGYAGGYVGDLGGAVWAVGDSGTIIRWDPQSGWTEDQPTTATLRAVYAITDADVWAVGDGGTALHWDGTAWQSVDLGTTADLHDVSFTPTLDGWIVGAGGLILHRPAGHSAWQISPSPTQAMLRGVFADTDETWAVGDGGALLHRGSAGWSLSTGLTTNTLRDVDGFPGGAVWAVGDHGTIFEWRWGVWLTHTAPTVASLRHVTGDAHGGAVIGGEGGVIVRRSGYGDDTFYHEGGLGFTDVEAVAFLDRRQGMALGSDGAWWRYDYASATWNVDSLPVASGATLYGMSALPYGAMRISATTVDIVDATTGGHVMTVPLTLRAANWHLSGEDVYAFDFTPLTTPGTYLARIDGLGTSDPFSISPGAYDQATRTTIRGLYHQRCGAALVHTDHPHGVCHNDDALYDVSVAESPLHAGEPVGGHRPVHGGWHDAGDYNKYVPTGASALWYLLSSFDLSRKLLGDVDAVFTDDWDLPESDNEIPDLLDEIRWELDWLVRLQEDDGGFAHKVSTECWFSGMPDDSTAPRYILAKTTHDTAKAAAILALGSRVWAPYDPALAENYLDSAEQAWDFLLAHPDTEPAAGYVNPPNSCTGAYTDPGGDTDERAWAAAELYRTTGVPEYHDAFAALWTAQTPLWGWNVWQHDQRKASWAYVNTAWPDVDVMWQQDIRDAIASEADLLVTRTYANAYHNGARLDVPAFIGWGAFAHSTEYALRLLLAFGVTGDSRYWQAAMLNLNTQLGANPLGMTFITGIGARSPMDPLHLPTMYDGIEAPVPGIPVFGPASGLSNGNPYNAAIQDDANSYPYASDERDPYPILRRYVDSNEIVANSEFSVMEQARTAGALALACRAPVDNTAPVAVAQADVPACLSAVATPVTLDGSASFDPDGDALTFVWTGSFGTVGGPSPVIDLPQGVHAVTLTVHDGFGETAVAVMDVAVEVELPRTCSPSCPCDVGEGHCHDDSDCVAGSSCVEGVGAHYGFDPDVAVCEPGCHSAVLGDFHYCSDTCPCEAGEGDCDSDSDCVAGTSCVDNVGAHYGFSASVDVCEPGCHSSVIGDWEFCSEECPCAADEGDCDNDNECEPGLSCVSDVGAAYGWSADVDVCM